MRRTMKLMSEAMGDVKDGDVPAKVTTALASVFKDLGKVKGVAVDELHGRLDFSVEGVGWCAFVCALEDGTASVTVHDTTATGNNATLAKKKYREASLEDALGAAYDFISSNLEEV